MYTSLFATFRPSYWTHTIHMLHMHNCHFMFLGSYQISNIYKWLLVWPSYWAHINTYTRYTWLLLHGPVTELTSYAYHIQNFYHHAQLFGSHHTHTTYTHLLLTGTVTGLISYIIYILYIYSVYYMAQLVGSYFTYTTYTPWPLLGLVTYQTFTTYQQHNVSYFHGVDEFQLRLTQYDNMHNVAVKQDPTKHLLVLINATGRSLIPCSGLNDNDMASLCEVSLSDFWFCLP